MELFRATFLQVALTTGARSGEIAKLKWTDLNSEQSTISINDAEKGSRNRTIKVPEKTISMVNSLPKKYVPYIFNPNVDSSRTNMCYLKKRVAKSQNNPAFYKSISTRSATISQPRNLDKLRC